MSDQAAPGWYPVDERTERWWDGTQWSEHQRPLGQQGAPAPVADAAAAPAVPYPYGGDAGSTPGAAVPAPGQAYGQMPAQGQQAYGQVPAYGQSAPGYAPAPATRSKGRIAAAIAVGFLGLVFTLFALRQIANVPSGTNVLGYAIGSLLIPVVVWVGFYFIVRGPRKR